MMRRGAIDFVLEIDVPFDEIIQRMSGRRVHVASGRTFHVRFNPPKSDMVDDDTGEPLIRYYNEWAEHCEASGLKAPEYRKVFGLGTVGEINGRVMDALNLQSSGSLG